MGISTAIPTDIIQKSETLAWDIAFLARSLGLAAYVTPCEKSCTHNGTKRCGRYFRVSISGDTNLVPVRLARKKCQPRGQRKNVLNVGITVTPVGIDDYYGFQVDGDGLFLLGDFTVTHNSLSAKAIASLWKLPLLRMDVGKIFGGIVGQSEENIRKAIRVAESTAPNIVWIDELEKGFSGTQSSGISDGGTTARVFGTFIAWLQDKTAPCFVVATANDVSALPPELLRKGRFDEIFFVDLPGEPERVEIFAIHLKKRHRDPANFDLNALAKASHGYSGAEIEQAVISAMYDAFSENREITTEDILAVVKQSVPLSLTMKEKIDILRFWAETRARPASSAPPVETQEEGLQEDDDRHRPGGDRLMPMQGLVEAFLANQSAERGLSPNTLTAYRQDLTQFLAYLREQGVIDQACHHPSPCAGVSGVGARRGVASGECHPQSLCAEDVDAVFVPRRISSRRRDCSLDVHDPAPASADDAFPAGNRTPADSPAARIRRKACVTAPCWKPCTAAACACRNWLR